MTTLADARRLDVVIWTLIGATITVIALAIAGPFHANWASFAKPGAAALLLSALAFYYARWRDEPNIHVALSSTSQIILFSAFGVPLSYVTQSLALPAWDASFAGADRALGLDWHALRDWMLAQGLLKGLLQVAYNSLQIQAAATILILAAFGHLLRLRVFVLAFILVCLLAIMIAALIPAEGIWTTYGLATSHTAAPLPLSELTEDFRTLHQVRSGDLRLLSADGGQGIISFPSVHTALALLFILAMWPVRYLRAVSIAVNGLMLASVPIHGSHYFVDMFGGVAIVALGWSMAWAIARRAVATSPTVGSLRPSMAASS